MNKEMTVLEHINMTSPTKNESEDAYFINETLGLYGVLDGATPLIPFVDEHGHNGAYLAAQIFKKYFDGLRDEEELLHSVAAANAQLLQKMKENHIDPNFKESHWTTCVVVVKCDEAYVEYAHLGDSMIIAEYRDGSVEVLTKDTVEGVSERALAKRALDRSKGISVPDEEYFEERLHELQYNRTMANIENGYSVANGMPEAMDFVQSGKIERDLLSHILLISDGFFHPEYGLEDTFREVKEKGMKRYVAELTEYLEKNELHIDDRTGILLKF